MKSKRQEKILELIEKHDVETQEELADLLKKAGFVPCGTIILKGGSEDGDARIAFERIL